MRLKRLDLSSSKFLRGSAVSVSARLKILGVTLDATPSFDDHTKNVVRAFNFHLYPFATFVGVKLKTLQESWLAVSLVAGSTTSTHCYPTQLVRN